MTTEPAAPTVEREPQLLGQTPAVIGGSSGIGLETARRARAEGTLLFMGGTLGRSGVGVGISETLMAALPTLAAGLAREIAPVRVNAGFVDTALSASLRGDALERRREQLRDTLPIGRVVGPADVAALAVHIMSNTALTGATFDIGGGPQLVASSAE